MSVADQVTVLRDGCSVQTGAPTALYREPADPWVAAFVGDAVLLPAVVSDGKARTPLGPVRLSGRPAAAGTATVLVRPEQIRIVPNAAGTVPATVLRHDFHGHDALVALLLADGTEVSARILDGGEILPVGAGVGLRVEGAARAWYTD